MFEGYSTPYIISFALIPIVFAVTVHEVAHGWTARYFGDPTADAAGRLTLNPISHIDPFGTILLPLILVLVNSPFIFGSAKPVPVNANRLRNPKIDMAIVALAGPAVNMLMAFGWSLFALIQTFVAVRVGVGSEWLLLMAKFGIFINLLLAIFNMLPIPPLDGGRVIRAVLPDPAAHLLDRIEPFGFFILLGLIALEFMGVIQFLSNFIWPPLVYLYVFFEDIARLGIL